MTKGTLVRRGLVFTPLSDFSSVKDDEVITVSWSKARNPAFHRKMFALFNLVHQMCPEPEPVVFQGQELVPKVDFNELRRWLVVKAGFYEVYGYPDGKVRVRAKSLSYAAMDSEEFEQVYQRVLDVALEVVGMHYHDKEALDDAVNEVLRFA